MGGQESLQTTRMPWGTSERGTRDARGQELRSQDEREVKGRQAGSGVRKWSRNVTELPDPPLCPVSALPPKHCWEITLHGAVSAEES